MNYLQEKTLAHWLFVASWREDGGDYHGAIEAYHKARNVPNCPNDIKARIMQLISECENSQACQDQAREGEVSANDN